MTIFVTWQLIVTLDSIRNSCDVFHQNHHNYHFLLVLFYVMRTKWRLMFKTGSSCPNWRKDGELIKEMLEHNFYFGGGVPWEPTWWHLGRSSKRISNFKESLHSALAVELNPCLVFCVHWQAAVLQPRAHGIIVCGSAHGITAHD